LAARSVFRTFSITPSSHWPEWRVLFVEPVARDWEPVHLVVPFPKEIVCRDPLNGLLSNNKQKSVNLIRFDLPPVHFIQNCWSVFLL